MIVFTGLLISCLFLSDNYLYKIIAYKIEKQIDPIIPPEQYESAIESAKLTPSIILTLVTVFAILILALLTYGMIKILNNYLKQLE